MGDVMGDLSSRRGVIQGMEDISGGGKTVKAEVHFPKCLVTPQH